MRDTLTVGELKQIIEEGGYSDDTPIVLESFITQDEVVALEPYPVETTLGNYALLLKANPYETMGYHDI